MHPFAIAASAPASRPRAAASATALAQPADGYPSRPIRDFQPISMAATLPFVLVVNPGVSAQNVKDLIALARAKPGSLNFAPAGSGGPTHLAGELFKSTAKIDIVPVPCKGNAAALADLVGGQAQMTFSNMLTAMPFVKAGKLRAIAVSTPPSARRGRPSCRRWPRAVRPATR